jgi:CheY-like chemotaxis protein
LSQGWRVRKDGSRFWANVIITALRQEDGRLIGFSKITRDLMRRTALFPSRRVLVVDDHVDAARMFELLLQSEGHETCIAHDGPTALKAVEEFKPEFVFLDIGIPGMNGYEIARRLKGGENRGNLFLVAVTGWGQPSDFEQSREAGFDLHLVKPVDSASVKRLLENPPSKAVLH